MRALNLQEISFVSGGKDVDNPPSPDKDEPIITVVAPRNLADDWGQASWGETGCVILLRSLGFTEFSTDLSCGVNFTGDNPYDHRNADRIPEIAVRHADDSPVEQHTSHGPED
jgi:hypothetical protein